MSKLIDAYHGELELPGEHSQESDLWRESVPRFCTRCEEIRGNMDGGSNLASSPQHLMWHSFKMCSECYVFQRDHPEEAAANMKRYAEDKAAREKAANEAVLAMRFRVYFLETNPALRNSDFVNSISPVKFNKFPGFIIRGKAEVYGTKSKVLVNEDKAKEVVELLKSKGLEAWYAEDIQAIDPD